MALNGVFELGVIKIKGEIVFLTEISVNASRTLTPRMTCDSEDPKEIRKGTKKVEFTAKRDIADYMLSNLYDSGEEFQIILYNNNSEPPQAVMKLDKCILDKDDFGPIDGSKPVQQSVSGQAIARTMM